MSKSKFLIRVGRAASALTMGCVVALGTGCASSGGSGHVDTHGSVYVGAEYYDPWYWGSGYVPPPAAIGPPPTRPIERPPTPSHPIATPPAARPPVARPMPAPRPAAMPRGGGGRR